MRIRSIILQIVAYILYAVVAFAVFLYVTFPYDLLQQRLVEWVSQAGVQLTMAPLRPTFSPGVRTRDVRLVVDQLNSTTALVHLQTLRVRPEWLALLSRKMQAHFVAELYSGRVEGEVHYTHLEGAPLWDMKARFADVDVAQYPFVRKDDKAFIRGRLSGEAIVTLTSDGQLQDGTFNLRVQPMTLAGAPGWQLQLQHEIACDILQGELKTTLKQGGNVALTCQGKDLAIDARGTVGWKSPLPESQLSLRWQIHSEEAYKSELDLLAALARKRLDRRGELTFRLQGPLRQLRLGT